MTTKAATSPSDDNRDDDDPNNARRFESTLSRILSVPKAELAKREAAYQKTRRAKPTRSPK